MIPAVIYAARSKEEEPGKDSTGDQVRLIREAIEREGGREIVGEPHIDHASAYAGSRGSGLIAAREEAERLASEHGESELWVFDPDRLARGDGTKGKAHIAQIYWWGVEVGVNLRAVENDHALRDPIYATVEGQRTHGDSKAKAGHVRRGLESRFHKGVPHGTPGLGYRHTQATDEDRADGRLTGGRWEPDPTESSVVRMIFRMHVEQGQSYSGIAKALNAEGVATRSGAPWAPVVIRKLINSRHTLGEFRHRGEWHEGSHPAIIDQGTWDAAQVMAERRRKYAPKGHSGRIPKNHVFLHGMLRCQICGASMLPRSRGSREWYACRTHAETHGGTGCPMPNVPRHTVEAAALSMFNRAALDVEATREHLAAQMAARIDEAQIQAGRAERDVGAKRAALDRIDRDYEAGKIDAENYNRLVARVREEWAAAEAERDQLTTRAGGIEASLDNLDAEGETFKRLATLREVIARRMNTAGESGDVGPLRAAWGQVFAACYIVPGTAFSGPMGPPDDLLEALPMRVDGAEFDTTGDPNDNLYLVPVVRAEMFSAPTDKGAGLAIEELLAGGTETWVAPDAIRHVAVGFDIQREASKNWSSTQVLDQISTATP